jgi:hypothetical protein
MNATIAKDLIEVIRFLFGMSFDAMYDVRRMIFLRLLEVMLGYLFLIMKFSFQMIFAFIS